MERLGTLSGLALILVSKFSMRNSTKEGATRGMARDSKQSESRRGIEGTVVKGVNREVRTKKVVGKL